jgi:hypothetical protein
MARKAKRRGSVAAFAFRLSDSTRTTSSSNGHSTHTIFLYFFAIFLDSTGQIFPRFRKHFSLKLIGVGFAIFACKNEGRRLVAGRRVRRTPGAPFALIAPGDSVPAPVHTVIPEMAFQKRAPLCRFHNAQTIARLQDAGFLVERVDQR